MKFIQRHYRSFLKNIQLQLFIFLISLPILISWGLPISLLSLFTTLLFTPILSLFLLISSLIFFSELLHIPNTWFMWLLEHITSFWNTCLSYHQSWWLIGFSKPSLSWLIAIVLVTLAILHAKQITTAQQRIVILTVFLLCACCLLKFFPHHQHILETLLYNRKHITLIQHNNTLIVFDEGTFSSHAAYESFITYTFLPDVIQKTGKTTIEHLIVSNINKRTFDALAFLATKMNIKNIYLPWWTGKIPSFAWYSYITLKKNIARVGGKVIPISKKRTIINTKDCSLFIEVNNTKNIRYYDAQYPLLYCNGIIDQQHITIGKKDE